MACSTPGLPVPYYLPEFSQVHVIESVIPSRHVILCHPFLLLPSIFPSIRIFSNESVTQNRWSKLSPRVSQESSSYHSSKASMFWCSGFFMVQLSHLYKTTGKTLALTIRTFVAKMQSSNFMVTVTICCDFRAPKEEICHYFHIFPFCLPSLFQEIFPTQGSNLHLLLCRSTLYSLSYQRSPKLI